MCETLFCSALTFRDNKHRNVGDVTKLCLDVLLWTWNFGENVLRHCKEMYFRYETHRLCTRYQEECVYERTFDKQWLP